MSLENCEVQYWFISAHLLEWLTSPNPANTDRGRERGAVRTPGCAGGDATWCSRFGRLASYKTKRSVPV